MKITGDEVGGGGGGYGGPQLSRQKQIVSPQKQIASRQKQTGYGKSKLEVAKANLLRQQQIVH